MTAKALHLVQHIGQHGFGRGSAQHDEQLFLDVADKFEHVEAAEPADETQYHDHKEDAGDIEADDQLTQRNHRTDAFLADGEGHGPESAQGSHIHDDLDDAEHDFRKTFDEIKDDLPLGPAEVQRKGKKNGHQQYLQNFAAGKG